MHALSTTHPMSKITRSAISWKPLNQKKRKKKCIQVTYFYIFLQIFGSNLKIPIATEPRTFSTSGQSAIKGPANSSEVTYSKIQNRLSRAPYATPMDRFLMQYLNNKCALTLCQCVKKWYLTFNGP